MRKIETIWHFLLSSSLAEKKFKHTQKGLADFFGYSVSTINHALVIPTQIGAIRKESKFFILENFQKMLYYWASVRNLEKDVIYKTYCPATIKEIEGIIPSEGIYACYSAASRIFNEPPADYSKVYFYLDEQSIEKAKQRFPHIKGQENVFVLKAPAVLKNYGQITTLPQTFVDIWNLKDWYGQDFTRAIENKINGILS
ncbi:MAG: hypothetical protein AAB740_05035 [Patescibacteria group bacterium]